MGALTLNNRNAAILAALAEQGATCTSVAALFGVSRQRVWQVLANHGLRHPRPARDKAYWQAYYLARKHQRHAEGTCQRCDSPVAYPGAWNCTSHQAVYREAERRRRANY